MPRVAVVTDSAADLDPEVAASLGIEVVPLVTIFGSDEFRTGVDMTTDEFWQRLTAPGAPFPRTAAPSPVAFRTAFERAFAGGADAIVCVNIAGTLSATVRSAQMAAAELPDREIHVIDTWSASMCIGVLAELAARRAAEGRSAAEIAAEVESRVPDIGFYVMLDTLEYLRRGGRISGARAALGTMLSVKPILTIDHGVIEQVERARTRSRARERLVDLCVERPAERMAVVQGMSPDADEFAAELVARSGLPPEAVTRHTFGPSIGTHVGPGSCGAVILRKPG